MGEAAIAVVVPCAGQEVNESELDALCLGSIARFKRPKAHVFAEELPKNSHGKVLKREFRARFITDRG
jgi:long-chain acyl-CoA synthetase